jgi:HK97 family phage major capsid protein
MHQEAEKEAMGLPGGISGTGVPSKLMSFQRKDLTVGSATSAGNTVATDLSNELIPALRPQLMTQALGARVRTGMTSNFDIARKTGETSMTWEGENDANAEGTPTTDLLQVRPNRGGVTVDISKQLLIQSSFDVEQMVREDIEFAVARGLDLAAINGSGASNQPRGILNTSGIGSVAIGTNGGVITYEKLVALKKAIAVDDALMGNLAFLTNPDVVSELEVTPRQGSGVEGNFIKNVDSEKLLSYRLGQSTQVPNTLTKGTSSGVCSALIFGNWSELSIYQFGGLDIVVDPYSKKTTSLVEITINSWWDIVVRHAQSFAAIQDLTTTQVS